MVFWCTFCVRKTSLPSGGFKYEARVGKGCEGLVPREARRAHVDRPLPVPRAWLGFAIHPPPPPARFCAPRAARLKRRLRERGHAARARPRRVRAPWPAGRPKDY